MKATWHSVQPPGWFSPPGGEPMALQLRAPMPRLERMPPAPKAPVQVTLVVQPRRRKTKPKAVPPFTPPANRGQGWEPPMLNVRSAVILYAVVLGLCIVFITIVTWDQENPGVEAKGPSRLWSERK